VPAHRRQQLTGATPESTHPGGRGCALRARATKIRRGTSTSTMASEHELVAAIIDVARELTRSVVPPRGAPYFCLDADATYDLRVFDSLSARGIFRKYEFALEIGSGLGGRARWLAARNGCRIVGVDPSLQKVAAAKILNRRAHMDEQVLFQVGRLDCLPLRGRIFTHVWVLDVPADLPLGTIASEAYRVLRSGGYFAFQTGVQLPAARHAVLETLRRAGFVEVEVRETLLADPVDACRIARERLHTRLQARSEPASLAPSAPHDTPQLQIFARRLG